MHPDGRLHLIFDVVPGGLGSNYLAGLERGDRIEILNCMGNFVLADTHQPNILFIARYTGIVPVFSMLKQLAQETYLGQVHLVYASPCAAEEILIDELKALDLPGLSLQRLYLDQEAEALPEERHAIERFQTLDPEHWNVYLCGVGEMVRPLRKRFRALECPRGHLKSERYN